VEDTKVDHDDQSKEGSSSPATAQAAPQKEPAHPNEPIGAHETTRLTPQDSPVSSPGLVAHEPSSSPEEAAPAPAQVSTPVSVHIPTPLDLNVVAEKPATDRPSSSIFSSSSADKLDSPASQAQGNKDSITDQVYFLFDQVTELGEKMMTSLEPLTASESTRFIQLARDIIVQTSFMDKTLNGTKYSGMLREGALGIRSLLCFFGGLFFFLSNLTLSPFVFLQRVSQQRQGSKSVASGS